MNCCCSLRLFKRPSASSHAITLPSFAFGEGALVQSVFAYSFDTRWLKAVKAGPDDLSRSTFAGASNAVKVDSEEGIA